MVYSKSVIAVPPGASIKEQLEDRCITQKEFAARMGMSEKHISNLINGKAELTQDVALKLESVLGIPARFWNNLESLYREKIKRVEFENALEVDIEIARNIPYAELANLNWVPKTRKCAEKVSHLRSFFEVANLMLLHNLKIPGIAYRRVAINSKSNYALAAWAQKARIEARNAETAPINLEKLQSCLGTIRSMTVQPPSVFCKELKSVLASCGVAIVFLPHMKGAYLHGASFRDGKHIVLGLTVRGRDADKFWFSLFHELHHILSKDIDHECESSEDQECAADVFARDQLISPEQYARLCRLPMNETSIVAFSREIDIAPGIVVGRLQKDRVIEYHQYNHLKEQYMISD